MFREGLPHSQNWSQTKAMGKVKHVQRCTVQHSRSFRFKIVQVCGEGLLFSSLPMITTQGFVKILGLFSPPIHREIDLFPPSSKSLPQYVNFTSHRWPSKMMAPHPSQGFRCDTTTSEKTPAIFPLLLAGSPESFTPKIKRKIEFWTQTSHFFRFQKS